MSLKRKAADLATSDAKKPKANASITSFFSAPKTNASTSTTKVVSKTTSTSTVGSSQSSKTASFEEVVTTPVAFDKEAWLKKLTPEQKDLLALEINTLDESWLKELRNDILTKDFLDLKRFLKKEHDQGKKIFPPAADVYSWYV